MKKYVLLLSLAFAIASAAPNGYHVIKEIKVGGEGGWDYCTMDSASHRLFISHANKVVVLDVETGKVAGEIPDTAGVHGITLAPELNRGFTSNGRSNTVTIFDLKTLATIAKVATGQNPDAIRYEPVTQKVFTFNGRSGDSTVIDAKTGQVAGTIPLGGKPEFAVADGKGKLYANMEESSEIVEIDAATLKVIKRYSLKPCDSPSGLAIDPKSRHLFSACDNKMMAISDPDSGKVIATPVIGEGPDAAAFDPHLGLALSSNGEGTLTVLKESSGKWTVAENAATRRGARTMALDEKTHHIFLPTAQFGPTAPAPAGSTAHPRPSILPDSFVILEVGR